MNEELENLTEEELMQDIKNLVVTCLVYINLKSAPSNPFVRKLGDNEEELQVFEVLKSCTNKLAWLTASEENKELTDTEI